MCQILIKQSGRVPLIPAVLCCFIPVEMALAHFKTLISKGNECLQTVESFLLQFIHTSEKDSNNLAEIHNSCMKQQCQQGDQVPCLN